MKINSYHQNFQGIYPKYTNKNGFKITPISQNPTQDDIDRAIHATQTEQEHKGLNGNAYFYGQDLVVKKYLPAEKAYRFEPEKEINALDFLYENIPYSNNIQKGYFAFVDNNDDVYLVSSKVKGKEANTVDNKFNEQNLKSLIKTFAMLDKPSQFNTQAEYDNYARINHSSNPMFPYNVNMHYDLSPSNVPVTSNSGGIIDFEYFNSNNCATLYETMNYSKTGECICDISDIPGITSNLRGFEYRTLIKYISKLDKNEQKGFFEQYLKTKSYYHYLMAQNLAKELAETYFDDAVVGQELSKVISKEFAHYKMLKNPSKEVLKAEAIKIQLCNFVYTQSQFCSKGEINPKEIKNYANIANKYFKLMEQSSTNNEEFNYWQDCAKISDMLSNVIGWMRFQEKGPKEIEQMKLSENTTKELINNHELFMSKITRNHIVTLDEMVLN